MNSPSSPMQHLTLLPGSMPQQVLNFPWESTPLGPMASWPQSLVTAVSMVLECQLPMYLGWGREFIQIYNDAYTPILGPKHPGALGGMAQHTWSEIWPKIGPMWREVLAGRPVGYDDFLLTINRFGYPENCYFNFSYSAVRDDAGHAAGILVTFAETTKRVIAERRLRFLDELFTATRGLSDAAEVMHTTARLLGQHLGVNRCAYANVLQDQDTFDLIGDYNHQVESIVGRYKFSDFGAEVRRLMLLDEAYVNDDVDSDPVTAGADLSAYRLTSIQAVICVPLHKEGRFVAGMAVHQATPRRWMPDEIELVRTVVDRCWESLQRLRAQAAVAEEARSLEVLNRTWAAVAAELELSAVLQRVTDAATELTGAEFGAFFYNGTDERGEAYMLYSLTGAPREAFKSLGHPRPTDLFGPTFRGGPPIRVDDILEDPRYGQWAPHFGMPKGHLPVRSYLAVAVIGRAGEVIGGLFFGHSSPGMFDERSERLAVGIASQAAIAVDNARLYAVATESAKERSLLLESERAARQDAERSGAIKDEFLSTLSHELRTPLSAITGWVHILRRKLDAHQADLLRGVEIIGRSAQLQVQLVEDLLDVSRITSGKLSMEMQPIALSAVVQRALEVVRPSAEAAGVSIDLDDDLVGSANVIGDANRLQQVVWNLLANSVKFTPRGGNVHVRLSRRGGLLSVCVSDTGIGIAPDFLPVVFERFRQADSSTTRKFAGLGLGLSIVRHVVELHGGTVKAHSDGNGRGATFTIELPATDLTTTAGDARIGASANEQSPLLFSDRVRDAVILLVDDDESSRDVIQRVLSEAGASVVPASDGRAALALFQERRFDVVVSDIGMPDMDGFEMVKRLRQLEQTLATARTPVIAVTAFVRPEDLDRALASGFDEHVRKPLEPLALIEAIGRRLRR